MAHRALPHVDARIIAKNVADQRDKGVTFSSVYADAGAVHAFK
jgi:hypothetical protein